VNRGTPATAAGGEGTLGVKVWAPEEGNWVERAAAGEAVIAGAPRLIW